MNIKVLWDIYHIIDHIESFQTMKNSLSHLSTDDRENIIKLGIHHSRYKCVWLSLADQFGVNKHSVVMVCEF